MAFINSYRFGSAIAPTFWTPDDDATKLAYYTGDSGIIISSGSDIERWEDQSGNDYHMLQDVAANRPRTGGSLNGQNTVQFLNEWFKLASLLTGVRAAMFVTGTGTSGSSSNAAILGDSQVVGNIGSIYSFLLPLSTSYTISVDGATANTGVARQNGNAPASGENIDLGMSNAEMAEANQYYFHMNVNFDVFTLGTFNQTNQNLFGSLGSVVLFSSVPSDALREQYEGYYAWKYGLVAKLPVSHPYKAGPPTI